MGSTKKAELIALLKGNTGKKARKTYSLRMDGDVFEKIEAIAAKGDSNVNDILNALIELGLAEFDKA